MEFRKVTPEYIGRPTKVETLSGNPGVVNGKLAGITSLVSPVCGHPAPTVFTRISHYQDWITRVIDDRKIGSAPAGDHLRLMQLPYNGFPQSLSALLLSLADAERPSKTPYPSLRDYGDFRDWYDEQMMGLETDHDRDPYHNPLVNQSILPIEYVLIDSKERDQAIKENFGRPVHDDYSTIASTTTEKEEIHTSNVYDDDDARETATTQSKGSVAHFTRFRIRKRNQRNERSRDGKRTFYIEGKNYESSSADESEALSLDVAEINGRIRGERTGMMTDFEKSL